MKLKYRISASALLLSGLILSSTAGVISEAGAAKNPNTIAKAKAQLKLWEKRPNAIGNLAKLTLSKTPPSGKTIAIIFPTPSQLPTILAAAKSAADLLGWTVIDETTDGTPQGDITAYQQALAQGATAIFAWGNDVSAEASGLAQAKAAGVPVFWSNANAPVTGLSGDGIVAQVINNADTGFLGTQQGYFDAIRDNGKAATILTVAIPAFPTTTVEANYAIKAFKKFCSRCKGQTVNAQISDIGVNIPSFIVTAIEKNPNIKFVQFEFTPEDIGVAAALKTAGITGITMTSGAPSPSDFAAMGTEGLSMMSTYDSNSAVWRLMDAYARFLVGGSPSAETKIAEPAQVIVPSNNLSQYAINYTYQINYVNLFKKLWKVS